MGRLLAVPLLVLLFATPAAAWSFEVHRFIADRAVSLLPPPLRPFFEAHRAAVVEHSIDPDLWRTAGFAEEDSNHHLSLDAYAGAPVPRDLKDALRQYGESTVRQRGTLPWRLAEMFNRLVMVFRTLGAGHDRIAIDAAPFLAAVIGHYISDAHVPFHASVNSDGQLTGQAGIHGRFERDLFLRYRQRLVVKTGSLLPVGSPRDFAFEVLASSGALAGPVLDADRRALAGRKAHDARYFDAFFPAVQSILERRLSESIAAVASLIVAAWEAAGRPALAAEP